MSELTFSHIPVLLQETLDSLQIKPDGIYVDATAGGAGHSSKILEQLSEQGRLICMDQDPDAIQIIKERIGADPRVTVVHDNFAHIAEALSELGVDGVDGILADLGVSSHQLDTPERGFSFHTDAPLDMRMSQEGPTAADLCNNLPEAELRKILYTYGEEKNAPRIAAAIVKARKDAPLETTLQLAELVNVLQGTLRITLCKGCNLRISRVPSMAPQVKTCHHNSLFCESLSQFLIPSHMFCHAVYHLQNLLRLLIRHPYRCVQLTAACASKRKCIFSHGNSPAF